MTWATAALAAFQVVGTMIGAAGQASAQRSQASAAEYQAEVARQQADRERRVAEQRAFDFRRTGEDEQSRLRARVAAQGIAGGQDTALLTVGELEGEVMRGTQRILHAGDVEAAALESEARLSEFTATTNRRAATTTLLGGAVNAGGNLVSTGINSGWFE